MVGNNKKVKKNYSPKFGKPKQMKPSDYHSSSSEDEEEEIEQTKATQQPTETEDNRLSDDSEHNFDDEDEEEEEEASSGSEQEDDEEDLEFESDTDVAASAAAAAKPTSTKSTKPQQRSDGESDEDEADDAEDDDESADADGESDDNESAEEEESDSEDDDAAAGNADWAKSLAKILKQEKPKHKKIVALSKAKKTSDILEAREKAKAIGFAIDGEVKEEKPDAEQLDASLAEAAAAAEQRRKKKAAFNLRIKPTLMDRERERAFKKIATKGVVQLFNAVRTQQKDLSVQLEKAGRLDHKRDAVLNNINKRKFLDVLMGGKRAKSENVDNGIKDEDEDEAGFKDEEMDDEVYNDGLPKNSIWSVLKEDFLSNKKMSHWDKDEEEEGGAPNSDGGADDDEDSD